MERLVTIVGGGLAGSEAAWRLARAGVAVELREMRPARRSAAHVSDGLAELVCSNSLRSDNPLNAVGLLHEELRRLGSLVLGAADETRVPAGDALAVDRERFSRLVTERLRDWCVTDQSRCELGFDLHPAKGLAFGGVGPRDALAGQRETPADIRIEERVHRHIADVHPRVHWIPVRVAAAELEAQPLCLVAIARCERRLVVGRVERPALRFALVARQVVFDTGEFAFVDSNLSALYPNLEAVIDLNRKVSGLRDVLKLEIGAKAPETSLPDASGKVTELSSLKGKYVLLLFWASWSSQSVDEFRKYQELYPPGGSRFVGVFVQAAAPQVLAMTVLVYTSAAPFQSW